MATKKDIVVLKKSIETLKASVKTLTKQCKISTIPSIKIPSIKMQMGRDVSDFSGIWQAHGTWEFVHLDQNGINVSGFWGGTSPFLRGNSKNTLTGTVDGDNLTLYWGPGDHHPVKLTMNKNGTLTEGISYIWHKY